VTIVDSALEAPPAQKTASAADHAARAWRSIALGAALPAALAIGWEIIVQVGWAEGRLLPPPSRIAATLWSLTQGGELLFHIGATLWRVAVGFLIGAVTGILTGALAGYSRLFRAVIDPTIQGLRAIPSLAWVPLFILWLGIFEESKVALIAVGVFFPVYLGVTASVLGVDRKIVEVGRIFRLKGHRLISRILVPAILPNVVLALRTGLGLGWMFVVAAEIMGAAQGLGYLLVDGQQLGKPDQIVAAILVFAVIGKITDALLVAVSRPFLRWQDSYEAAH
jgi:sulfonate transport system permease protein